MSWRWLLVVSIAVIPSWSCGAPAEPMSSAIREVVIAPRSVVELEARYPRSCTSAENGESSRWLPDTVRTLLQSCQKDGFGLFVLTASRGGRFSMSEYPAALIAWDTGGRSVEVVTMPKLHRGPTRAQVAAAHLDTAIVHQSALLRAGLMSNGMIAAIYRDFDDKGSRLYLTLLDYDAHQICVDEFVTRTVDANSLAYLSGDTILLASRAVGSATRGFLVQPATCPFNGIQLKSKRQR